MQPAAAAAQPLALDQARLYIQRLLSIINERNVQMEMLKTHLEQKTELCKLHEDRAERAEANTLPDLSPADLAALNTLPPSERDATWLRRVFARGDRAPLGPYELAGLYLDAFAWTRTAASGSDIVAAVARVFPGVQLVQTECGLRFRGLERAQVAPSVTVGQEAQARQLRTERTAAALDPYASTAEASSSSRPASPRPPLPPTVGKRKRSPEPQYEPDRVPEAPTGKRVRTAQGGAAMSEDALDLRMLRDVGTSPLRIPAVEKPPRSTASVGTQTVASCKTYADAQVEVRDTRPRPTFSIATQTIDVRKMYAETEVQVCETRPALQPRRQTYAEAGVQACDTNPQIEDRPPDRDALLADPHAHIPPGLPPLRVPRDILQSTLPNQSVRIVQNLQRGDEDVETFRPVGEQLEYLGTYVFKSVCVGYSRTVHEALARAVLDAEVRVLSRLGVGDSDSEGEDGEGGE